MPRLFDACLSDDGINLHSNEDEDESTFQDSSIYSKKKKLKKKKIKKLKN